MVDPRIYRRQEIWFLMKYCFSAVIFTLHCQALQGKDEGDGSAEHRLEASGWSEVVTPLALRVRDIIQAGHDLKVPDVIGFLSSKACALMFEGARTFAHLGIEGGRRLMVATSTLNMAAIEPETLQLSRKSVEDIQQVAIRTHARRSRRRICS